MKSKIFIIIAQYLLMAISAFIIGFSSHIVWLSGIGALIMFFVGLWKGSEL